MATPSGAAGLSGNCRISTRVASQKRARQKKNIYRYKGDFIN